MRTAFVFFLAPFPVLASADEYSRKCTVTPSIKQMEHYPGRDKIVSSNNLALPEGKAVYASGQRVYISGRVFDKNCVPVPDAIVEIWQENPDGQYIAASLSDRLSPYPYFTGSGRFVTDNLGRYNFITLFPGTDSERRAPHINFHVTLDKFPALNTQMYFAQDRRNRDDVVLNRLAFPEQDLLLAKVTLLNQPQYALDVKWNIVLDGVNQFRKY